MSYRGSYADVKMKEIVAGFIEKMEQGAAPWVCPHVRQNRTPRNLHTRRTYRGLNTIILWAEAMDKEYQSNYWVTFKQAKQLGGHVKAKQKGTSIIFWDMRELEDEPDIETGVVPVQWVRKIYTVFNLAQCEGLQEPKRIELPGFDEPKVRHGLADCFIERTGARITTHPGSTPSYSVTHDEITIPSIEDFINAEEYYASVLHELSHWTGHRKRLGRILTSRFGEGKYAFEELTAEISSAFLGAYLGIDINKVQHAEYLNSWCQQLKLQPHLLWSAASHAQKAHDYLIEITEPKIDEAVND